MLSRRFKLTILTIVGAFATVALVIYYAWDKPLISPLTASTRFHFLQRPSLRDPSDKIVYGFLPYWNLSKAQVQPELTHLAYFSLTIGADGSILTREADYAEPGYHKLHSEELLELSQQALKQDSKVEIVVTQFNPDDMSAFLASPPAQQRFLASLDAILLAYPVSGVNLDLELSGGASPELRQNMTQFVRLVSTHLRSRYVGTTLSIDMYASAARGNQLWDVAQIEPLVDYIVVMAYDFHRRGSPQAGPVAPLFGGKELWDSDINQHLQEFVQLVPPSKILLGVPFYGYEWQTTSRNSQSHTFPDSGATASVERVNELLTEKRAELKVQEHWNEDALSPYLSYEKDGKLYVIYYENSRSLSYKLDYVNQLQLAGIAIWALGFEGDSRELWDVIERKIVKP